MSPASVRSRCVSTPAGGDVDRCDWQNERAHLGKGLRTRHSTEMKREVVAFGALLLGCGGGGMAAPLPECEQAATVFTAKPSDGAATISDLEIQGPTSTFGACRVVSGCVPRSTAHPEVSSGPCAEVHISATGTATTCDL